MKKNTKVSISGMFKTPIGDVYVDPTGTAKATWRIGQAKDGQLISISDLSDKEIEKARLKEKVNKACADANRLYS